MAKSIDYLTFMVGVTPYEHEGHNYDALNVIVAFRSGRGFVVTWQPVKQTAGGYMTDPMPSSDPLVGGAGIIARPASRNSMKTLETMKASLLSAKEGIRFYFDQRNWPGLKEFMGDVASNGYNADTEKQLKETIRRVQDMNATKVTNDSPLMKQFRDLKSKHPAAVLLFRCGDFYEALEDDAKDCASILGITLTKNDKGGYRLAGFPHHALDTYLPKLVRAGKRVAICDILEDPKKTTTNNNQNKETMKLSINQKNETKNAAKQQVNNNNSEPVMHEVDVIGLMGALNRNGEAKLSDHFKDAEVVEPVAEIPADATGEKKAEAKAEAKPKHPVLKRKSSSPAADEGTAPAAPAKPSQYTVSEYTTKKGGMAYLLFGFESKEAAEKIADKCSKTVGASWRTGENGEKRYCLSLGTRYGDVARTLCGALNAGDQKAVGGACAASRDIYEMAVAAGKAEREARKAERKARRAEREAETKAEEPSTENKSYTPEEVAAMLEAVANGGMVPEDVRKHIKQAE